MAAISFRTDPATNRALSELTEDGATPSEAIRSALLEAARRRRQERLRNEAERLTADPEYLAEVERVRDDMKDLRAR